MSVAQYCETISKPPRTWVPKLKAEQITDPREPALTRRGLEEICWRRRGGVFDTFQSRPIISQRRGAE